MKTPESSSGSWVASFGPSVGAGNVDFAENLRELRPTWDLLPILPN